MIRLFMIYTGLLCAAALGLWFGRSDQKPLAEAAQDIEILPEVVAVAPSAPAPVIVELPESLPEIAVTPPEVQIIESQAPEPVETAVVSSSPAPVPLPPVVVAPSEPEEVFTPTVEVLPDVVEEVPAPVVIASVPAVSQMETAAAPVADSLPEAEVEQAEVRPAPAPVIKPPAPAQTPAPVAEPAPRLPLDPVIEALIAQAALAAEAGTGDTYVVQPGDSLLSIARALYGNSDAYQQIFDANRDLLPSIDAIQTGQTLRLP
ncbi:LysM peptidoglycan-binding domain-containing protein [Thalassobacter stenotrophicus]|uniref:LysM domain/BON superfamily protein n=2 Tax=Thalassobacter stenotrophicus TaxID=266809 RepID=A0A0P1EW04_9RHOB|nr:LysM peptidoglycan-binding domain-containing protein [Thalassobacter stenotrophicus]PVZ50119.1 LysM peptidoglycan-binding domain-containing protein [Thalassobacter stenotrophicus]CUH59231.1 LysM domain/BON superfamily protein [Thalassobacter stenotrophicus]SHI96728.1 Nucleoid-associated protein YgaU, contains BON and LysM domains [Thalassobacter stenotrophicus DSM 16310]